MGGSGAVKIRIFVAWFDMWVGTYWDRQKHILYICLLPMIVIAISSAPARQKGENDV